MPAGPMRREDPRAAPAPAEIRVDRVAPGVYGITLSGYFVGADADRLIAIVEPFLSAGAPPHLFFDTEALSGYRSEFRERMTIWYGRRKADFGSFNALVRSKVVAMAIAVANLLTSGRIVTFGERDEFERAKRLAADRSARR